MANLNLNKEQIEALWPIVSSSRILSAIYAAGKVTDVYAAIEADDVRELAITVLNQFEDGDATELVSQVRSTIITIDHTVSAVIRFRTRKGYFSSVEFLLPLLGEEKLCDLIEEAAKHV